ncbi:MAG TPA: ribonuclease P protein component [Candidatus Eremiobacteraceae bacterium]|nr:ribonuclease P protein component [Candidatus Eremiobacteraceae bacterium]
MRRFASLRGRREFALVLRRGQGAAANGVHVVALKPRAEHGCPRIGIVIKKQVGNAVLRNRLRRRCKAILDEQQMDGQRYWFVIQCKPEAARLSYSALRVELLRALASSTQRVARARPNPAASRS